MLTYTWKRLKRSPLMAVGVVLFSFIMVTVVRKLYTTSENQLRAYDEIWHTIPIQVTVTNLSGTRADDLHAPVWVANTFLGGSGVGEGYSGYLKDVQVKASRVIDNHDELGVSQLVGLTAFGAEKKIQPENITWIADADEGILLSDEMVCFAPIDLTVDFDEDVIGQQLRLYFKSIGMDEYGKPTEHECDLLLTVVGYYGGENSDLIYCPYSVVTYVCRKLAEELVVDSVSATLLDNDMLDDLVAARNEWFAAPTPGGSKTEWGYLDFEYYPYAMDINDELLMKTAATLENSILVNQICTLLIYALSAGASFLIGFLMIQCRRREISLMRTLGCSSSRIYIGYVFEHMLCAAAGTLAACGYFRWIALNQVGLLTTVFFGGISTAMLFSLHKKLAVTLREEE